MVSKTSTAERLYRLVPSYYRRLDGTAQGVLKALLSVMGAELDRVEQDIEALQESWFIETCESWAIPYIADLLGIPEGLVDAPTEIPNVRRLVAHTVAHRRRSGAVRTLRDVIRDATDGSVHVAEFGRRLAIVPHLDHVRRDAPVMPSLVSAPDAASAGGPFDRLPHAPSVRIFEDPSSRHHPGRLGLYVWRARVVSMERVAAVPATTEADFAGFFFHGLGVDTPLYERVGPDASFDEPHLTGGFPIDPHRMHAELHSARARGQRALSAALTYGESGSTAVYLDGLFVAPEEITVVDLDPWTAPPRGWRVALDPRRGRLSLGAGDRSRHVEITFRCAQSYELGGGAYDRVAAGRPASPERITDVRVRHAPSPTKRDVPGATSFTEALARYRDAAVEPTPFRIRIEDHGPLPPSDEPWVIPLRHDRALVIEADNRKQPWIHRPVVVVAPRDGLGRITLDGLGLAAPLRLCGSAGIEVHATHCTIWPRLGADEAALFERDPGDSVGARAIVLDACLVGPIHLPGEASFLQARDSLFLPLQNERGTTPAPSSAARHGVTLGSPGGGDSALTVSLERCTVVGDVRVRRFDLVSESILAGEVHTVLHQHSHLRYSSMDPEYLSKVPDHFRCQPATSVEALMKRLGTPRASDLPPAVRERLLSALEPRFVSIAPGSPGVGQLHPRTSPKLRRGAQDGAEMGAFRRALTPHREASLRACLSEYVPVGCDVGVVYRF